MTEKKPDPKDIANTATGAAGGIPKPIVDAATKPPEEPQPPKPEIAGGTVDIGGKKKK